MFYENLIPYYSPYEEQEILRQMNRFNHRHRHQKNSFYYYNKKQEYTSASLINSSLPNSSLSSTSSSSLSKKIIDPTVDALSFCHTIYITIKKHRDASSSSSGDSQLLLLPDICCTIPASKLSYSNCMILNIISSTTLSLVNLLSYSISLCPHILLVRLHHHYRYLKKAREYEKTLCVYASSLRRHLCVCM